MHTHPLWRPFELPSTDDIAAARAGLRWTPAPVEVVAPDPTWPERYAAVHARIVAALGDRVLGIEHVGSTAVPGLWAKPVIDIDLTVVRSADEDAWLPDLESAGFELRIREPHREEHRALRGQDPATNVHVFSPGAREPRRHRMFRDWLTAHGEDRDRYSEVKREAAARGFTDAMLYNNVKAWFVYDLYEKVFLADPRHPHDPHPRGPVTERDASHWAMFNARQVARETRPLLVDALAHVAPGEGRVAIDLGCGDGTETRRLLADGWTVHALDGDEGALDRLASAVSPGDRERLDTRVVDLDDLGDLPAADLVYAGYTLPYTRPSRFPSTWSTVTSALKPGAVLAVNLFGEHDSWAGAEHETYLTEAEARALFSGMEVLHFQVEDEDGEAFSGPKHWHVFDVIARRR